MYMCALEIGIQQAVQLIKDTASTRILFNVTVGEPKSRHS